MDPSADRGKDNAMAAVQRWRALLDTQMHFNSMIVQTSAIGMSVIIAVFGAAALSLARAIESQQAGSAVAFDLTSALSKRVSARRASIVLAFFYGVPFLSGCLFLAYVMSLRP